VQLEQCRSWSCQSSHGEGLYHIDSGTFLQEWLRHMNPRTKRRLQLLISVILLVGAVLAAYLASGRALPFELPGVDINAHPLWLDPIWHQFCYLVGITAATSAPNPDAHFAGRFLLTLSLGLVLFLPEVERTFMGLTRVVLGRRPSRADTTICETCGHLNRATVSYCVRCGSRLRSSTSSWR